MQERLKRFHIARFGNSQTLQEFFQRIFATNVLYGSLSPKSRVTGEDQDRSRGIESRQQSYHRVIFHRRMICGSGQKNTWLPSLRMEIDHGKISLAWSRFQAAEDKVLRSGNIKKREIFGRRADENQIVVFRIVEREQRTAFNPELAIE